ncbi:MAG: MipA/OmpV family protein [Hydrogenophaga sp.]|nr:MipA/OmpV family protein [Hydrogenophaga sp.]
MSTHSRVSRPAALLVSLALFSPGAHAEEAPQAQPGLPGTGKPLWELGVVGFSSSQPAYPGSGVRTNRGLVVPYAVYRGEFWRVDRDTVGLRAVKTPTFELDVGFAGSFGTSSDDLPARSGMPDLGTLVEFGPRVKWHLGAGPGGSRLRAEAALRGVLDLSDGLAYRGLAFEPRLVLENRSRSGWNHSASLGLVAGNRRLGDTLYGVAPEFATGSRPAYAADGGLVAWRLGLTASKSLNRDWLLFGFARLDSVAGAANGASPLVEQRSGATVGMGLSYTWARSTTLVPD